MPRKPTLHARQARARLLELAASLRRQKPFPTLAELARDLTLHPSTIFRILRGLAEEGLVWQSPQGKFYAVADREKTLRGAPVCFIGREMWQWSRLYQEMLEGIAEVCSANGSPLVLLSSRSLVRQDSPTDQPLFASLPVQKKELAKLVEAAPRGCAGFLLDHLWKTPALEAAKFPGRERIQLLAGDGQHARVFAPDYDKGAALVAEFLREQGYSRIGLVIPFKNDPAIDLMEEAVRAALKEFSVTDIPFFERPTGLPSRLRELQALVCLEDNVADALSKESQPPFLIATQGTGLIQAPHVRLRVDYRRLGRAAASHLLHGTRHAPLAPALIVPSES
jgi:DNA-binding transcriptional regulator YhcF (GntR family)